MPIPIERADEVVVRRDEIFTDRALGKKVTDRKKKERFMGCAVSCEGRPPVTPAICIQVRKV